MRKMSFFKYDGMDFHYEREGEGAPILFIHGLGGDMKQCQTMLASVKNVRKIFMDVRGHGETAG